MTASLRHLATRWFPVLGSIPAWAVHLVFLSAYARESCTRPSTRWALHAATVLCLAVAALATALSARHARAGAPEDAPADAGRTAFLGRLGVAIGLADVLLIALEGLYAVALGGRTCG